MLGCGPLWMPRVSQVFWQHMRFTNIQKRPMLWQHVGFKKIPACSAVWQHVERKSASAHAVSWQHVDLKKARARSVVCPHLIPKTIQRAFCSGSMLVLRYSSVLIVLAAYGFQRSAPSTQCSGSTWIPQIIQSVWLWQHVGFKSSQMNLASWQHVKLKIFQFMAFDSTWISSFCQGVCCSGNTWAPEIS